MIKVGRSKIAGKGVFASQRIDDDTILEESPYVSIPMELVPEPLGDYVYTGNKPNTAMLVLGHGMIYNHSQDPNVDYYLGKKKTIVYYTTRSVKKGEELTISYGSDWWESRDIEPI